MMKKFNDLSKKQKALVIALAVVILLIAFRPVVMTDVYVTGILHTKVDVVIGTRTQCVCWYLDNGEVKKIKMVGQYRIEKRCDEEEK